MASAAFRLPIDYTRRHEDGSADLMDSVYSLRSLPPVPGMNLSDLPQDPSSRME